MAENNTIWPKTLQRVIPDKDFGSPAGCSTKGSREWKRHPPAYGMVLFTGMFPKTRLNGINMRFCDAGFLILL